MKKVQMFCLPYSGGSASIYFPWKKELSDEIDVIPMEYLGHGSLFNKAPYESIQEAAKDISLRIANLITSEYIVYGHSMGSLVALETTYLLSKMTKKPLKLIIGAARPPHLYHKLETITHLPKKEFMQYIFNMGQTSEAVMQEPELLDLLYEIIYSDYRMIDTYVHDDSLGVLNLPITVFGGDKDDRAPYEDLTEWQMYTTKETKIITLEGKHFFAFNGSQEFYQALRNEIRAI